MLGRGSRHKEGGGTAGKASRSVWAELSARRHAHLSASHERRKAGLQAATQSAPVCAGFREAPPQDRKGATA